MYQKIVQVFTIHMYKENKLHPLTAMFFNISKSFLKCWQRVTKRTFVQNILLIRPVILDKTFLKFWHFPSFLKPQKPKFYKELNSLNNFERSPSNELFCEVILNLVHWFRRRNHVYENVNRLTDKQRGTVSDHNSSPCTASSIELKKHQ